MKSVARRSWLVSLVVLLLGSSTALGATCATKRAECDSKCGAGAVMKFSCESNGGSLASSCACASSGDGAGAGNPAPPPPPAPPAAILSETPKEGEFCRDKREACVSSCDTGTVADFDCEERADGAAVSRSSACTCLSTGAQPLTGQGDGNQGAKTMEPPAAEDLDAPLNTTTFCENRNMTCMMQCSDGSLPVFKCQEEKVGNQTVVRAAACTCVSEGVPLPGKAPEDSPQASPPPPLIAIDPPRGDIKVDGQQSLVGEGTNTTSAAQGNSILINLSIFASFMVLV